MLHNQNDLHLGILTHDVQQRIVRGETTQLARELRTPRRSVPRLEAQLGGYSVPKMRSPASPRPGRM
jgi:hypothetical protein